jgi:phosphoribosylformylglycinamidine synthase
MLGLLMNPEDKMTLNFKNAGDLIYLIGEQKDDLNQSEYLKIVHGVRQSPAPQFDLEAEYKMQSNLKNCIKDKRVLSAHDVSEGGVFQALVEAGLHNDLGFEISSVEGVRKDAFLFGENQSRVIVTIKKENQSSFEAHLKSVGQHHHLLGDTTSGSIKIDNDSFPDIEHWKEIHGSYLNKFLEN